MAQSTAFSRFRRLDQRSVPKRSACWDGPWASALRQRHGWAVNGAIDDLKKWRPAVKNLECRFNDVREHPAIDYGRPLHHFGPPHNSWQSMPHDARSRVALSKTRAFFYAFFGRVAKTGMAWVQVAQHVSD